MPIDVSPPMSGNLQGFQIAPVQSTDPLQTLAQMSQLRTQGLQQQQAQLGITQAQQKMDSNRAIMQSLIDGDGNWDKTDAAMRTHPEILPEDYAMVREHAIKALTDRQALDKGQLDIQDREHKNWASLFEGAKTQDDVNNVVAAGLQQGYKPPPNFVDEQGNLLHNFVGPDAADQIAAYRATLLLPQDLSEEKLKTQQTATSAAEARKAEAEAAESTLKTKQLQGQLDWLNNLTPQGLADYVGASIDKTKYPDLYARAFNDASNARAMKNPAAVQAAVDKYAAIASEQEKTVATETNPQVVKTREDIAKVNAQNRQNITIQGMGTPDQPSTMAQMVANYQVPLNTVLARTPLQARDNLMAQIKGINPQFQEQYYQSFQKTENDATSGKLADSSRALNTMMGHLATLKAAGDALNNSNLPVLNRIANGLGLQMGSSAKTVYDTIVHRLGPEVTKAYVAGGGTSGERGSNEEDFSSSLGPDQRNQNIGISAYLADSLIKANQDQYNRGTYGRGQQKLISDEAEAARQQLVQLAPAKLRKQGGQQGGGQQGGPPLIKTKAEFDNLPSGTLYMESNGKTYRKP
jgi:hypothetical protein